MTAPVSVISSMATRQLLADLAGEFERSSAPRVRIESVGGVDAAKRVHAGEAFDAVVLAADAIDELIAAGKILPANRVDLVRSGVAIAVRSGAERPDIESEEAAERAVLAARKIGYSTGPSGVQLVKLFERWGIAKQIEQRLMQAPPGVPVGKLVADGEVELGFQQLSELMSLPGIAVLGPLPEAIQIVTTFSAGVASASSRPEDARAVISFMASSVADEIKRRNGMEPA
ncbi:MAG: substrate-binding domain-containing protein [Burkholderiales bacterium]